MPLNVVYQKHVERKLAMMRNLRDVVDDMGLYPPSFEDDLDALVELVDLAVRDTPERAVTLWMREWPEYSRRRDDVITALKKDFGLSEAGVMFGQFERSIDELGTHIAIALNAAKEATREVNDFFGDRSKAPAYQRLMSIIGATKDCLETAVDAVNEARKIVQDKNKLLER